MYQGNQQGTTFSQNAQQPYHAGGYVQSHYQGQLSQPSFGQPGVLPGSYQASSHQSYAAPQAYSSTQNFTPASQSLGPVISRVGWQAGPDLHQQPMQHSFTPNQTFNQQASSHSYTAGPVISRYGYQAGPDSFGPVNQSFQQQQHAYQPSIQQAHQPVFYGATATSATHQHPVYQATNAYAEAGPVIQHFGGWESNQR
ncbi:hypothetical protein PaecuDRAFT_0413 [Paenibacillus curdlanolyticus YK9]|uniref:Uncharacterized protein n=1 Tax=Paenibacillus curdlanolyticus YK9 TaxID=717606 RepID=E0I3N8_9BACL|nr:hypothetical protein [Paenibacillus curdlanolyticus]EFM12902.1 hypothetical protein PaecuDRAFT_0413 [Paenibacillus curdlanolyticus YK9]